MHDELIHIYGKRLYGLCRTLCERKEDADDIYQETWLRVLSYLGSFDKNRDFEPYLTKICINTYRSFLKTSKSELHFDAFSKNDEKDAFLENIPEKEKDDLSFVRDAVDKLPEKLRTTVILFYFFDFGEKKTAQVLQIPAGTVKSRLNKAKKLLKEELINEQFVRF